MAGTLQVNERSAWTPAGWIFNNVLERVALRVEGEDPSLAETVLAALGPNPGHLDLCFAPPDRLQAITRATEEVCRKVEASGPSVFPDATFFGPYLEELHQLLRVLRSDPRWGGE
jgi:hypothetical protein